MVAPSAPALAAHGQPSDEQHVASPAPVTCANCGAEVLDRYCGHCGQRRGHAVHSLAHFAAEATEDLTHADSRLWRTLLALLFRPGFLTTEFLADRRAHYLPPVRLYLVLSVVFFLVASSFSSGTHVIIFAPSGALPRVETKHEPLAQLLRESMQEAQRSAATSSATPSTAAPPAAASAAPSTASSPALSSVPRPAASSSSATADPTQQAAQVCAELEDSGTGMFERWFPGRWQRVCPRMLADNGANVSEALFHNLPRALFVFMPLIALVMKLLYRHPPRYYVEHLLFLLHNHAFVFLTFTAYLLLVGLTPLSHVSPGLFLALSGYSAWYLYRGMRRVYGQSRTRTACKFVVLAVCYAVSGGLTLALTTLYSVLTL
ncbi:MAG TPA: DUF3667 domain-containing protein [Steroidobacteraceae bacterium]|nr:DUF3667 domain-containing protein [Steroidobacteraceae bacterium]